MTSVTRAFSSRRSSGAVPFGRKAVGAALGALLFTASPLAAQGYTEPPDLSNDPLAPTPVSFGLGSNIVSGTTGRVLLTDLVDADYFTFTLGADQVLSAINVLEGTTTHNVSFIGIDSGNQVTRSGSDATGLLGWTHYGETPMNILPAMSVPSMGSSGFGVLGAGTYSVWIQEANAGGLVNYNLDFVVGQVPEPATWALMLGGFGLVGLAFRRRRGNKRAFAPA